MAGLRGPPDSAAVREAAHASLAQHAAEALEHECEALRTRVAEAEQAAAEAAAGELAGVKSSAS